MREFVIGLVEVDLSKPVYRMGLAAIGTIDVIDTAFGIGAAQKALVIDFTAPCVRFDNGEFARAAKPALRDEFSHTLVLFGQEDGKNPSGYGRVGGIGRAVFELAVVVIDLPEQLDGVEIEGTEIVLTVGVVILGKVGEPADRRHGTVGEVIAIVGNAAGDDKLVGGERGTDEGLCPERVVECADLLAAGL